MTTYYADLDLPGTGGDGLSEVTAWHAVTFLSQANGSLVSGDVIKARGGYDYDAYSGSISIKGSSNAPITIENWGDIPWRMKFPSTVRLIFRNVTLKNCIVDTNILELDLASLYGSFLKATEVQPRFPSASVLKGCTLVTPLWTGGDCGPGYPCDLVDCVIDCPTFTFIDSVGSDNCCWTIDTIPGIGVHNKAQTSWTPPSWPAWNAEEQSEFSSTLLSAGILSEPPNGASGKPNPGNPPYTDYDTGLWGSTRTGIGSMYFSGSTTTTAAPTTTTIAPELLRKSHGPVITDGGPGSRNVHGNMVSDYHSPWWLL